MARARLLLLTLLCLASATVVAAAATPTDVCVGPIVKLSVFAPDGNAGSATSSADSAASSQKPFSTEYAVVAAFGGLPPNATSPHPRLRLRLADPATACGGGNETAAAAATEPDLSGAWVLAARGGGANCSFAAKYDLLVKQRGAAGLLVYDDRPGCVVMGKSPPPPAAPPPPSPDAPSPPPPAPEPQPDADADTAPPALSLDHDRGLALSELVRAVEGAGDGGVVEVEAWLPDLPPALTGGGWGAAASALALAAMATGTVVWGSLWSGRDRLAEIQEEEEEEEEWEEEEQEGGAARRRRRRRRQRRRPADGAAAAASSPKDHQHQHPLEVTPAGAVWFVLIASASLLAIWVLRGPFIVALLTFAFAAGGAQGVAAWLAPLLRRAGAGADAAGKQRVPAWAAAAVEVLLGLPPLDEDQVSQEGDDGWQALPSSSSVSASASGQRQGNNDGGRSDAEAPADAAAEAAAAAAAPPESNHSYFYPRADLIAAFTALTTAILWFAADRAGWPGAWAGQDVLAVSLLAQLLRALRLPNFQAACVLLPLVLVYDVFWVFLQPRMFGGESVMVDVATGAGGGGAGGGRPLPLLLRVPSPLFGRGAALAGALPGLPASISPGGGDSLLGFGDVVLPGMLAAMARRVDVGLRWRGRRQGRGRREGEEDGGGLSSDGAASSSSCWLLSSSSPYLFAVAIGYAVGLGLTFLALRAGVGGEGGQPALLYLSPSVLSAFALVAWRRGEMREVWTGGAEERGLDDEEEEDERR